MKTALIVTSLVAAVLAFLTLRRSQARASSDAGSGIPDDPDGQILKQLAAAGSDLSKPHPVELFLYYPDQARASVALHALTADGYTGHVEPAALGPGWLCFVTRPVVPSHATMVAIRARMTALARAGDGEYDGWGTPVVR